MARFDSDDLVATVQHRGRVPVKSGDWTAANIMKAITEEAEALFPRIIASKGEYNLLASSQSVLVGISRYRISKYAFDNATREVWLQDSQGKRVRVTELSAEELTQMRADMDERGTPKHFWFDGGNIELYPVPDKSNEWTLKTRFHPRPNKLVAMSAVFHVSNSVASGVLTGAAAAAPVGVPTSWFAGDKVDFIRGTSPFDILAKDVPIISIAADKSSLTFSSPLVPSDFVVGDYVALAGETPFLNMPESLALPAALNAAATIIAPQGDNGLAKILRDEAAHKLKDALDALVPRTKAPTKKLNNRRWF